MLCHSRVSHRERMENYDSEARPYIDKRDANIELPANGRMKIPIPDQAN